MCIWDKAALTIIFRSIPHVLVNDSNGVKASLAAALCLAAPLNRRILLVWFLHYKFRMLPIKETLIVETLGNTKDHLRSFCHGTHDFSE